MSEQLKVLSDELSIKDEALEELAEEMERLKIVHETKNGKDSAKLDELQSLRKQLKEAESKDLTSQEELKTLQQQVKDAQKKEQTQMTILARIKKEQGEEAKKAKILEAEAESKNAQKEAAAAKVEELEKEMELVREARATRETIQAVAAGTKVVLTAQQQSAFGACRHGRKEELTDLLGSGVVHANCINEAGNSLVVIAAQNNQKDVCKVLHHRGADLDTQNRLGQTALHFAFAFGYTELGKWLVQKGANTNLKNANGMTCYQGLSPAQPAMPFVQRYVK